MSTDSDAQRHARGRDTTWTAEDDRALAAHASWDRHVRQAMAQSRRPDRLDELVMADAAARVEAVERSEDAVHRRNAIGHVIEAVALISVLMLAALVAIVVVGVMGP
jgi:hypothetical protein